jgi:hypothetical protein
LILPPGLALGNLFPKEALATTLPRMASLLSSSWRKWVSIGVTLASFTINAAEVKTQANVPVEITFHAKNNQADPFNTVTLDALFTGPGGKQIRVPAFWAGSNVWRVRYSSPLKGKHQYKTTCSDASDGGLHNVTGTIIIEPYRGTNALYLHGPITVSADQRHFEHLDGTPFFWLGDTWWMGLVKRLHWPEDVQTLAEDRKRKGFNVIQLVAGLYPDMYPLEVRGENEAGVPWTTNYTSIRPEFFDAADKRLFYLADEGLSPCIVGAWGYFMPWMHPEKARQHWRYLIARYGSLPVVWCIAGEANLPWYQAKGFPYDDREAVKGWTEVMRYVRETDPFHRLITIHPTGIGRPTARRCTDDVSLLDFDMLQTPHGGREAVPVTINAMRQSYEDHPVMPVINGEASFEMLGDSLKTEWTRRMFWICMMNGAAGHTYGANGIWQVNRKGQPHGPSPTTGSPPTGYGAIAWDDAMNLPGSSQVALGKRFLESLPWRDLKPHPDWASFPSQTNVSLAGAKWIWFPEGNPQENAPAEKRYFRRTFAVRAAKIKSARLRISADDQYEAFINGKRIGNSASQNMSWSNPDQFDQLASLLKPGTNILAVVGENRPAGGPNPAGLIATLEIEFEGHEPVRITTGSGWLASRVGTEDWKITPSVRGWADAAVLCRFGEGPWGSIGSANDDALQGPQCLGDESVRAIYLPERRTVLVRNLRPGTTYACEFFEPTTGTRSKAAALKADKSGTAMIQAPTSRDANAPDWVALLRR